MKANDIITSKANSFQKNFNKMNQIPNPNIKFKFKFQMKQFAKYVKSVKIILKARTNCA